MAGAGEGEQSRLRVGPYVAEPATGDQPAVAKPGEPGDASAVGDPGDASAVGDPGDEAARTPSPQDADTQLIPVVRVEPAVVDAPTTVRAVARRVASALPALGRDESQPKVPRSARTTVDRRQRSRPEPAPPPPEPTAQTTPDPPPPPATGLGAVTLGAAEADDWYPPGDESVAEPGSGSGTSTGGAAGLGPDRSGADASGERAAAGEAPVAEVPIGSRGAAESSGQHRADDGHDGPAGATEAAGAELVRPGPYVIDADSWESELASPRNEAYHGRRRAKVPALRLWIMIGVVLAGLTAAIGIPLALRSSPAPDHVGAPPVMVDGVTGPPSTEGGMLPAVSSPAGSPTPSPTRRSPSPRPAPVPPTTAGPTAPTATPSPTPPPFEAITLQAEAAARAGSAQPLSNACEHDGLTVVRGIGDWGSDPDGTVTFGPVTIPSAGDYVMTVHYITSNSSGSRNLVVTLNGAATSHSFPNTSCDPRTRQITLTLEAGAQTMVFGNPDARAPSIDKIVIARA
jgi:hypothetical protein